MSEKRIALANGEFLDVPDDFTRNDDNFVKIRLEDEDGFSEGIWVWLSDNEYSELWNTDYSGDEYHVALLANHALMGIPWGCFIPIKYRGDKRPLSMKSWLDLTAEPCMDESLFENKE